MPRLSRRASSPDVVVIGGGIVGVAAAAHLAEAGRRVLLVERDDLAAGASGRNSGVVQHPLDPDLIELHLETVALYRRLEATVGADTGFRLPQAPSGLLNVTHDDVVARSLAARLRGLLPHLAPTYLAPDEARRLEPGLAEGVAACRLEIGYPVAPALATRAYAAWARALGVEIRIGASAGVGSEDGRVRAVRLDDGTVIATETVVVAAGPWTPEILDPSGRWRPIRPTWGVVLAVDLADPPRHVLEEADIRIEPDDHHAAGGDDSGADDDAADGGSGVAFSLITADGASSLGSTFLSAAPDPAAMIGAIVERGARFLPAIADSPRGAHRVCARPLSEDGRPLVGRVPGVDGLWVAAGHGPWGISTGPASGRLVADLVTGRAAAPPASLDPARFGSPAG
jgi:D-amino-acid dehydrogenase